MSLCYSYNKSRVLFQVLPILFSFIMWLITLSFTSSFVSAGEYHNPKERTIGGNETLACSQCHTMHGTQGGTSMLYGGSTPQPKLLRHTNILNLCLYCHSTDSAGLNAPDVWDNTKGYVASGGDFADGNYENEPNRHSVGTDVASITPPGYTGTWSNVTNKFSTAFNCIYCHDQHGNRNYRNLRYDPGTPANDNQGSGVSVTYTMGSTGNNTVDVNNLVNPGLGLDKYARNNVTFKVKTPGTPNNISAWCGRCHVSFYGVSGDANGYMGGISAAGVGAGDNNSGSTSPWKRHPVGDINVATGDTNLHEDSSYWTTGASFTAGNPGSTNRVRFADQDATVTFDSDEEPFCLSCHYAHGGGNPRRPALGGDPTYDHSNLVMLTDAGALNLQGGAGTYRIRNVCQQCHNQ